jgi:hypothetical protein
MSDAKDELVNATKTIRNSIRHGVYDEDERDCAMERLTFIEQHAFPLYTDKDGKPIMGDAVLYGYDGTLWKVDSFECGKLVTHPIHAHRLDDRSVRRDLKPEWLSRERPDTVNSLLKDMRRWIDTHDSDDCGYRAIVGFADRLSALTNDKEHENVKH